MGIFKSSKQKKSTSEPKTKEKASRQKKKKQQIESEGRSYMKHIVSFVLYNSVIWVYLSYILAFMDKTAIAEQLSIVVVKVIIYTILSYAVKALVENIFKYNYSTKVPENPYVNEEVIIETPTVVSETSDSEVIDSEEAAG